MLEIASVTEKDNASVQISGNDSPLPKLFKSKEQIINRMQRKLDDNLAEFIGKSEEDKESEAYFNKRC